ncbi:hypothetical protein BJ165DRAFT_1410384 [Panaeolus papilionaceus]|nr:hypothetical protein BJ165DRAFT_1410384 [Panaeolus papilionaceus]
MCFIPGGLYPGESWESVVQDDTLDEQEPEYPYWASSWYTVLYSERVVSHVSPIIDSQAGFSPNSPTLAIIPSSPSCAELFIVDNPHIEPDTVKSSEASGSAYAVQVSRDHDDGAPSQYQLKLPTTKTSDSMMPTINTAILPSDDSVGSILYTSDSGSGLTRKKFIDIQAQVDIDQSPSTGQSLSTNSKVDQDHQASTPHVDPSTIFSSISTLTGNFEDQRSESTPTSMHGKGDALSEDSLADQPSDDLLTGLELLARDDQSEPPVQHCKGSKVWYATSSQSPIPCVPDYGFTGLATGHFFLNKVEPQDKFQMWMYSEDCCWMPLNWGQQV